MSKINLICINRFKDTKGKSHHVPGIQNINLYFFQRNIPKSSINKMSSSLDGSLKEWNLEDLFTKGKVLYQADCGITCFCISQTPTKLTIFLGIVYYE